MSDQEWKDLEERFPFLRHPKPEDWPTNPSNLKAGDKMRSQVVREPTRQGREQLAIDASQEKS